MNGCGVSSSSSRQKAMAAMLTNVINLCTKRFRDHPLGEAPVEISSKQWCPGQTSKEGKELRDHTCLIPAVCQVLCAGNECYTSQYPEEGMQCHPERGKLCTSGPSLSVPKHKAAGKPCPMHCGTRIWASTVFAFEYIHLST